MATNLQFIKSASGTSVSSLDVTDCFSADYDVYKIVIDNFQPTVLGNSSSRFIDSVGSVISSAEYDYAALNMKSNTTFGESRATNQTFISPYQQSASSYSSGNNIVMYVFNPYDSSSYSFCQWQSNSYDAGALIGRKGIGVHKSAEQITGINFLNSNGGNITIDVSVYGVK